MRPLSLVVLLALALGCSTAPVSADSDAGSGSTPDAGSTTAPDAGTGSTPDAGTSVASCPEDAFGAAYSDPRLVDDACMFDRWKAELPSLSRDEQRRRVRAYLKNERIANEAPLRSGQRVVFLAEYDSGLPSLAGDFNGWDPTKGAMQPLFDTGYAYREETLSAARHSYKFVYNLGQSNETWVRDPAARWIEFDGVNTQGVGTFNAVVYVQGATLDRGLLRLLPAVHSAQLGNDRDVYVYLPKSAFTDARRYPSVYLSDGNESLSRAQLDRASDDVFAQGGAQEAILVFVALHDQNERMDEYTFENDGSRGALYVQFLSQTLVPLIDAAFPTVASPHSRAHAGSSLGGLVSAYAAWLAPETFGLVGSQSGSFFWPEPNQEGFRKRVEAAEKKDIRFYLDHGTPGDNDWCNVNLVNSLQAKGYEVKHVVEQGGQHDWQYWKRRWPGLLGYLLPKG